MKVSWDLVSLVLVLKPSSCSAALTFVSYPVSLVGVGFVFCFWFFLLNLV